MLSFYPPDWLKKMIDINNTDFEQINDILKLYLQSSDKAYAFGSRVRGNARKNSDLDIVIEASDSLSLTKICDIKDAFAESDIPFRVDLSDWHLLSDSFKRCIINDKVLIYPAN
ncbi:MAG: putative nucleotidyltransferase [Phenylobacterium sp.]|jgi:predicted nucleotidyltransferase